jgi:guanylate kinase
MTNNPLPPLFILSGPSGAGKTTVVNEVLKTIRFPLRRAVTATTRLPRPGEQEGVDYHFWTADRFRTAIDSGEMLEHAVVFGRDYYGTPRAEVDPYRLNGTGVILVIDVQGAAQVRGKYPGDHVSIFLHIPSLGELERRLRDRKTEDDAKIARRLETAQAEIAQAREFQKHVMNDMLPNAVRELTLILEDEFVLRGSRPCSTN